MIVDASQRPDLVRPRNQFRERLKRDEDHLELLAKVQTAHVGQVD
jgi:hypothetical protein